MYSVQYVFVILPTRVWLETDAESTATPAG